MDIRLGRFLNKEQCQGCNKNILKHHKFAVCSHCNEIAHEKCALKFFDFDQVHEKWQCWKCKSNQPKRYNPFSSIFHDKHHPDDSEALDEIETISNVLNTCQMYNPDQFNELMKQGPNMALLFNNIDGVSSNFESFSAELDLLETSFAAICLAETNLDTDQGNMYHLPGYKPIIQSKIPGKKKGSGLAIYVNERLVHSHCDVQSQCSKNLETLFIKITNLDKPMTLGVVYRPPSAESLEKSVDEFEKVLLSLPKEGVHITGDFNINLLEKNSPALRKFEELTFSNCFTPTISIATHFKPGCNPSCIDNILTQAPENLLASGVLNTFVSHHAPIFCIFSNKLTTEQKYDPKNLPKYNYSNENIEKFVLKLEEKLACPNTFRIECEGFVKFNDVIKNTMEESFSVDPSSTFSRRNRLVNPWITSGIISSIKEKILLYENWKKTVTNSNKFGDLECYTAYSKFRKILKHTIKQAKKLYMYKKFQSVHGDCKKTWKLINELRGKQKHSVKSFFIINGEVVENRRKIANEFNNYFISVATQLNESNEDELPILPLPKFSDYLNNSISSSMFMDKCTATELSETINGFNSNKASDIPVRVLKSCKHIISLPLSIFFNHFIDNSIFPDNLKLGQVTPIFKKGDCQQLSNLKITGQSPFSQNREAV